MTLRHPRSLRSATDRCWGPGDRVSGGADPGLPGGGSARCEGVTCLPVFEPIIAGKFQFCGCVILQRRFFKERNVRDRDAAAPRRPGPRFLRAIHKDVSREFSAVVQARKLFAARSCSCLVSAFWMSRTTASRVFGSWASSSDRANATASPSVNRTASRTTIGGSNARSVSIRKEQRDRDSVPGTTQ